MLRFIGGLIRPYRRTLIIILSAMFVETLMSLATPWPLKIILDNAVGHHKLPHWLGGAVLMPQVAGALAFVRSHGLDVLDVLGIVGAVFLLYR